MNKKYNQQRESGYRISSVREKKIIAFLEKVKQELPEAYAGHFTIYIEKEFDVKTLLPRINRILSKMKYSKEDYTYMYKCETKNHYNQSTGRMLPLSSYTFLSFP